MRKINDNRAITLLALVIIIVVLVIIGGVTIGLLLQDDGVLRRAIEAREQQEVSEITEKLEVKKAEIVAENKGSTTVDEYLSYIEAKGMIKSTDISSNSETSSYITMNDEYIFLVEKVEDGNIKIEYKGKANKLIIKPHINIINKDITTNSVTIKFSIGNSGGYKIFFKEQSESYGTPEKETTLDSLKLIEDEIAINNLHQGETYTFKIEAKAKLGASEDEIVEQDIVIKTIDSLTDANTTFQYDKNDWTNGSITVTAVTTVEGFDLQTSKDGIEWENKTSQEFTENGVIYARLVDSIGQEGGSTTANVDKIDKAKPTCTITGSTTAGNSGSVTITNISDGDGSGIKGYYWGGTSSAVPTVSSSWTTHTSSSLNKDVTSNGTYYIWFIDNANNISQTYSATVSGIVDKVVISSFTYSSTSIEAGNTSSTPTVTKTGTAKSGPTYSSSDTNKATVNSTTGVVTGVSAGETTITVQYVNYDNTISSSTCKVTITVKPSANVTYSMVSWSYGSSIKAYYGASSTCNGTPSGKRYAMKLDKSVNKIYDIYYGSSASSITSSDSNHAMYLRNNCIAPYSFSSGNVYIRFSVLFTDGNKVKVVAYFTSYTKQWENITITSL